MIIRTPSNILWILFLILVAFDLQAQVKLYPLFTVSQKGTFGSYRSADQEKIFHLVTEGSYAPNWNSLWTFCYRRSGVDYADGFVYRQNHLTLSTTQWIAVDQGFWTFRSDIVYVSSNSGVTDANLALFAEVGAIGDESRYGGGVGWFFSAFADTRSYGISPAVWMRVGTVNIFTLKTTLLGYSGNFRDGQHLFSGQASLYLPVSSRAALLVSGEIGSRALFYDPDIKLVYNTLDLQSLGGGMTLFLSAGDAVGVLADVSLERYQDGSGKRYTVTYVTLGAKITL